MARGREYFEWLYQHHHDDVRRFVGRRLARDAVEDATVEVFVVVWRRLDDVPSQDWVLL